jgi:hypothetical protein
MNTTTLARAGTELMSAAISRFIDGTALMLLRGRKTRKVLSAFKLGIPGIISMILNKRRLPYDDNYEVDPIPAISEIGIWVEDESHSNDFERTFKPETHTKDLSAQFDDFVSGREVVSVVVVIRGHENGVDKDQRDDGVVKPPALAAYFHSMSQTMAFLKVRLLLRQKME